MCGIFGVFHLKMTPSLLSQFKACTQLASHRGPDHTGYFHNDTCFLGHNRLSIIDTTTGGDQPFHFKQFVFVFNGEIFNYLELRQELIAAGYTFDTESDTEVALKSFDHWGTECFTKWNGMWALVIYDQEKNTLLISRDRFGKKSLFTMIQGNTFYFASELQQLAPLTTAGPDYPTIQAFLKEGGYDSQGRTFFKDIHVFPKAHYSQISAGDYSTQRYWDYWQGPVEPTTEDSFKTFDTLLESAVNLRLRADVPLSVLLSGGVDSTLIAAYAKKIQGSQAKIPAFTYSSQDAFDESQYATQVAQKLEIPITLATQESDPESYLRRLKQLVKHLGRGHSSAAIVSIDYLYEKISRTGVKIALDGQGADELLAGYEHYHPRLFWLYLTKGQFKQALYVLKDQKKRGFLNILMLYLRNILPAGLKKLGRAFYGYERFFTTLPDCPQPYPIQAIARKDNNPNALNRYLIAQHDQGLENLLYYGDIVAMKNSIENRSPFMDHRLVSFAFSRSEALKVWNGLNKYVLRQLPLYHTFRAELERKKIGFSSNILPETKKVMIQELCRSPILSWPMFTSSLQAFVKSPEINTGKYERFLFRLYQVHVWNEIFLCSDATHPA